MLTIEQIRENYDEVRQKVDAAAKKAGRDPREIEIISVSKTHPFELIKRGLEAGVSLFGENYAQELKEKYEQLDLSQARRPRWHFIGHLQRNKVKYIAPFVEAIHTVDSEKLAKEISKQAKKSGREIDIMLQVNTSGENSKSGCEPEDVISLARAVLPCDNLNLRGLMTIGTFTRNEKISRKEFALLRYLIGKINARLELDLKDLSMGMSHDFEIAVEEGATFVRIGTDIFGERKSKV